MLSNQKLEALQSGAKWPAPTALPTHDPPVWPSEPRKGSMTIPLVRVRYLLAYSEAVERLGGDAKRLLREARLSPELLASVEGVVPLRRMTEFVKLAAREVGPTLGSTAAPRRLTELGPIGQHLAAAPTLSHAFERLAQLARSQATGASFVIRRQEGLLWLCRTPLAIESDLLLAQLERYVVEVMLALVRHWLGEAWRPEELWLQSEPWGDDDRFADVPRLRHRAPQLGFPVSILDAYSAVAEPGEPSSAPSFDETPFDELTFTGCLSRVLETQLPLGQISLPEIAELVGTSARTLQRRLDAQGTTYSVVLDEVRQRVALERLRHSDATVTEIAHDLGYSDSAHFARAFRRWSGLSPLELRRQHRR